MTICATVHALIAILTIKTVTFFDVSCFLFVNSDRIKPLYFEDVKNWASFLSRIHCTCMWNCQPYFHKLHFLNRARKNTHLRLHRYSHHLLYQGYQWDGMRSSHEISYHPDAKLFKVNGINLIPQKAIP